MHKICLVNANKFENMMLKYMYVYGLERIDL